MAMKFDRKYSKTPTKKRFIHIRILTAIFRYKKPIQTRA